MENLLPLIIGLLLLATVIVVVVLMYKKITAYHRSINMVFLKVRVPQKESKEDRDRESEGYAQSNDFKEFAGVMTHFFQSLHQNKCKAI